MPGLALLDVAIGISFVFLLLSTVCLAMTEIIELFVKKRGRLLAEGLSYLLKNESVRAKVYSHPLIEGLRRDSAHPSYIPASSFASALLSTVFPEGLSGKPLDQVRKAVSELNAATVGAETKQILEALVDKAEGNAVRLRAEVEAWYDQGMERVAGWYKRYAQTVALGVSAVLVLIANADAIAIARHLSTDPAQRAAIAKAAEEYVQVRSAEGSAPAKSGGPDHSAQATPNEAWQKLTETKDKLDSLALPLGWSKLPVSATERLSKLVGLLLSIFAVSLGAPFWFDVLNKFVVVRSTVKPREKSEEVASKDTPRPSTPADASTQAG